MDYALLGIAAFSLLLVALTVWSAIEERAAMRVAFDVERNQWTDERRELLNRAQFPERMPMKRTGPSHMPPSMTPETRRALHEVGTVAPQVATDE